MNDERRLFPGKKPDSAKGTGFTHNRAYVIGVNAYSNGIPPLRTAVADAERLGRVLEEFHGYQVRSFPRDGVASLANLKQLLRETMPQEVRADDRVLLYFAGHGVALDGEDGPEGFLVPEDAKREDRASFLAMTELHDAINELPCRHLLLILDCCFAGAFRWSSTRDLSTLPSVIHRERFERYIQDPAWQVLTSAAHDQTAFDVLSGKAIGERIETDKHSPFAAALFRALAGDADLIPRSKEGRPSGDGVITATELYLYMRECVETATLAHRTRQTPGLWPLKKHDRGEYILLTPGHVLNLPPAPELKSTNNPYRGLQSFDEQHRLIFFGRTRVIEELRSRVTANALTVVLGASGTGKSSVVKAGLVPDLRSLEGKDWQILPVIRPGKSPLASLASVVIPGDDSHEVDRLAQFWSDERSDENALADLIKVWAESQSPSSRLLLVVDQFEELVTLCWDDWERERCIQLLASAVQTSPEQFRLVITLRSDFEPQFADCPLKMDWTASRYVVPPMTTDELREAIEGPASAKVLYFQPTELINRLIYEVIQTPGALPLLSFTLSELYIRYIERRADDRCLTAADYERLGGVAGSLRSIATELYDDLDGPHQATMERIMLRMASIQGGELARRRVPKSELIYSSEEENERVATVLKKLIDTRLVVGGTEVDGEPYVEPAHDALVRGWEKLLVWIRDEQSQLTLRRLLTPAANDWKKGTGGLWHSDPRLSQLSQQLTSRQSGESSRRGYGWLNLQEGDFVEASVKRRQRTAAIVIGSVAIAFLLLSLLTVYALTQQDRATARARAEKARRIANASRLESAERPQRSLLLAVEAIRASEKDPAVGDAVDVLRESLREMGGHALTGHQGQVTHVVYSADDRFLFTGATDGTVLSWDLGATPCVKSSVLLKSQNPLRTFAVSPDTKWLAVGSSSGRCDVAELDGRGGIYRHHQLNAHKGQVNDVRFTQDGTTLVTVGQDGYCCLWGLNSDGIDKPVRLNGGIGPLEKAILDLGGKRLIAHGSKVLLWQLDVRDPQESLRVLHEQGSSMTIFSSAEGRWLAAVSNFELVAWDLSAKQVIESVMPVLPGGTQQDTLHQIQEENQTGLDLEFTDDRLWTGEIAFSSDGRWLAAGRQGGGVLVWDLQLGNLANVRPLELKLPGRDVRNLIVDTQSRWLIATDSRAIYLWPLGSEMARYSPIKLDRGTEGYSGRLVISADGNFLAEWSNNSEDVELWDLRLLGSVLKGDFSPPPKAMLLRGHDSTIRSLEFSNNGESLVTGSTDSTARIWNLKSGNPTDYPAQYEGPVATSSNSPLLFSGDRDGQVRMLDLTDARMISKADRVFETDYAQAALSDVTLDDLSRYLPRKFDFLLVVKPEQIATSQSFQKAKLVWGRESANLGWEQWIRNKLGITFDSIALLVLVGQLQADGNIDFSVLVRRRSPFPPHPSAKETAIVSIDGFDTRRSTKGDWPEATAQPDEFTRILGRTDSLREISMNYTEKSSSGSLSDEFGLDVEAAVSFLITGPADAKKLPASISFLAGLFLQLESMSVNLKFEKDRIAGEIVCKHLPDASSIVLDALDTIAANLRTAFYIKRQVSAVALRNDLSVEGQTNSNLIIDVGGDSPVVALATSANDGWLAAGKWDGTLCVWDLQSPRGYPVLSVPQSHQHITAFGESETAAVVPIFISNDGQRVVTTDRVSVRLWERNGNSAIGMPLRSHSDGSLSDIKVVGDRPWLILCDRQPYAYDLSKAGELDKRFLLSPQVENIAESVSLGVNAEVQTEPVMKRGYYPSSSSAFSSPRGNWLLCEVVSREEDENKEQATTTLWNLTGSEPSATRLSECEGISSVAFDAKETRMIVGCFDGTVHSWSISARNLKETRRPLPKHTNKVAAIAVGPSGDRVYTASWDGTVRITDLGDLEPVVTVLYGGGEIYDTVGVSSDENWLAAGSRDGTVAIWDLEADNPAASVIRLRGHEGVVRRIEFVNKQLLVTNEYGISFLWSLDLDDLLERARLSAGRNLSREAWGLWFPGETYRKTFSEFESMPIVGVDRSM